ncbi:hypothetical protein [Curtobacterium sp. L1-20]|uniref:hypothetical protein n=1 Tax=Curtobacterium sp. L1-20 TaxID=3138181 RepID=UPI003B521812
MYGAGGGSIGGGAALGGTLAYTGAADPSLAIIVASSAVALGGVLLLRKWLLPRRAARVEQDR